MLWGSLTPLRPCKALILCYFVQVSRLWCLGLFTTKILRDFSGGEGALKSPKGEGHPLSLLSLKGTIFGLLRKSLFKCVLSIPWLYFMLTLPCYNFVSSWFWYSMHVLHRCFVMPCLGLKLLWVVNLNSSMF